MSPQRDTASNLFVDAVSLKQQLFEAAHNRHGGV